MTGSTIVKVVQQYIEQRAKPHRIVAGRCGTFLGERGPGYRDSVDFCATAAGTYVHVLEVNDPPVASRVLTQAERSEIASARRLYTRQEVQRIVHFALNEAPMLRDGYRATSVARIVDSVDRLNDVGVLVRDHDGVLYSEKKAAS